MQQGREIVCLGRLPCICAFMMMWREDETFRFNLQCGFVCGVTFGRYPVLAALGFRQPRYGKVRTRRSLSFSSPCALLLCSARAATAAAGCCSCPFLCASTKSACPSITQHQLSSPYLTLCPFPPHPQHQRSPAPNRQQLLPVFRLSSTTTTNNDPAIVSLHQPVETPPFQRSSFLAISHAHLPFAALRDYKHHLLVHTRPFTLFASIIPPRQAHTFARYSPVIATIQSPKEGLCYRDMII